MSVMRRNLAIRREIFIQILLTNEDTTVEELAELQMLELIDEETIDLSLGRYSYDWINFIKHTEPEYYQELLQTPHKLILMGKEMQERVEDLIEKLEEQIKKKQYPHLHQIKDIYKKAAAIQSIIDQAREIATSTLIYGK
ncbi:MAG: hypothetical protein R3Y09_04265 [Clostridia bacterium]